MSLQAIKNLGQSVTFLRIASLIAGTTLWFYVLNSEPVQVEREFPLRLIVPNSQAIANEWPQFVKLQLKGARVFLENIDPKGLEIVAELASNPKTQILRLTPSMVTLPFGVEVVSMLPDTINIQLVKESAKSLKVRPNILGETGPDMAFDIEKIEPPVLKVLGPWSILKELKDLPTANINWNDLDASKGSVKLSLRPLDQRLRVEHEGAREVELFFKVRPKKANMTLKNIPIRFLSSQRRLSSKTQSVALDVLVAEGSEGNLKVDNVQVVADIPEGKKGDFRVELRAVLPDGVHLLQIHPASINITVK
jgi:YbbR domain-containing protein